jgi:Tfp pilus assembly protein, ATPase PilM
MFFAAKPKGFILDRGEQTTLLARVSALRAPLVLEELRECETNDESALAEALTALKPKKASGYAQVHCGINPPARFIRRATLDVKRMKEEGYLAEVVNSQFRIDPEQNVITVLNAFDGLDYDATKGGPSKEVVFCGLPIEDVSRAQDDLLKQGLFPARLELSSLTAVGAIIDYLKHTESSKPTLVLELGAEQTQSYIVSSRGIEATRPIAVGLNAMVPVVQKELGLKDEESARKLFFSNTFDFTGMGASLCKRLLKELQSSMGFYEVQTGQSISQLICPVLAAKLNWLEEVIAAQVGVSVLQIEFPAWLAARQISLGAGVNASMLDARKLALLGLMMEFNTTASDAVAA